MRNYQAWLDRLEAELTPEHDYSRHVVFIDVGQPRKEAAERYATAHRLAVAAVLARGIFVQFTSPYDKLL